MSQNIVNEVTFLLHSFLLGIVITLAYDGFLILRRLIRHNLLLISLEDMIYWIACAIGVFYMLCEENNGMLRWFAVSSATLGMIVYKKSIGERIVDAASTVIKWLCRFLGRMLCILGKPFVSAGRKAGRSGRFFWRKAGKVWKYWKNKLTGRLKLLKMILCKR